MPARHRSRRFAGLVLAAMLVVPACSKKRDADPETPAPGPVAVDPNRPAPKPKDPPVVPPKVVESPWAGTAIKFGHQNPVTFGPHGCPVLVVGTKVYDAATYQAIRQLPDPHDTHALRDLTADGKSFAAALKSANQTDTAVAVWSTEHERKLLDIPGKKDAYVDLLRFHGNHHLLVGGRHNRNIDVWDIAQKKIVATLTTPDRRVEPDQLAFSADGKHFAGIAHDKLVVVDLATNKPAATMEPPSKTIGAAGKSGGTDSIFVFAWTRGLAFSPDGKELALFSTNPSPRLLVWNLAGKMVLDQAVPMPQHVTHRRALEWMPDGRGWLVNGHLLDRKSRRVALSFQIPFASDVQPHFLDGQRIIAAFGDSGRDRLHTITVPWDRLNASLGQLAKKTDAYLTPGTAVSLQLDLGTLRGDEAETRKILTDALTARLAQGDIAVAPSRPTVLRFKLSEEAGETLPIYERQSPFDLRGANTGRKATESKGAAVLELWAEDLKQPLWRSHVKASSSRSFREEITDAAIRKSMLEHLTNQLAGLPMPYFLPKSKDLVALPAVVE